MELYIVRHGETDWNKEKRIQGRADIQMNEAGRLQVENLAKTLSDIKFDQVYASPLKRAIETALVVSGKEKVKIDERLIEIDFGQLEGVVYKDIDKKNPKEVEGELLQIRNFFIDPEKYTPVNGETYASLLERVGTFLEEIKEEYKEGNKKILLVSHATCIHAMLTYVRKSPLKNMWESKVGNCSVSKIIVEDNRYKLAQ